MSRNYAPGKILCKGSGLKAYLEMDLKNSHGDKRRFRYELGNLENILTEVNRQAAHSYVAGRKTAVGTLKGIRNSYGTITFSQIDENMLNMMFEDVKKWNAENNSLIPGSLDGFMYEDWTLAETDAALLSEASEELTLNDLELERPMALDDLPPVDIVVVGTADQIDTSGSTAIYEVNKTYVFKAKKVVFLSETFGISAGSAIHNVATKVLILGGIEPWKQIEGV